MKVGGATAHGVEAHVRAEAFLGSVDEEPSRAHDGPALQLPPKLPLCFLSHSFLSCLSLPTDPRLWSEGDVSRWLNWAIREFSLEGVVLQHFRMRGRDMCAMGKENFLARTPPFMGDILWEHLEILQKGMPLPAYAPL